jgi:endonuclease/exonuclease/phosphatase family metal-dependent hydrolase
MELLVRTWNVFHGNARKPGRRSYLRQMIELASYDRPDVLCLQEVPLWALERLGDWSGGMQVATTTTLPSMLPRRLAGWITRCHQGLWRSAIAGQANAILVAPAYALEQLDELRVSMPWKHPRRIHSVRVAGRVVFVNAHLSADAGELERTFAFAEAWSPVALAGDLNRRAVGRPGWSAPAPGIDHVLGRGLSLSGLAVWNVERRTAAGVVLSDHAPVEATVSLELVCASA